MNSNVDFIAKSFLTYINNPVFSTSNEMFSVTPWERVVRVQDINENNLNQFLTKEIELDTIASNYSLLKNRVLSNIYDQDMLFLPDKKIEDNEWNKFYNFYNKDLVSIGASIKNHLEENCFHFLENKIKVTLNNWSQADLETYFKHEIDTHESFEPIISKFLSKMNSKEYAKLLLIQMSPDFLSEASAMCRALIGNFGTKQSGLMKIFIDEYGYGIHIKKHSSIFEKCMMSVDINPQINYYHFFYLPTSLMLTNYFHYVCSNKRKWFRYLGALYYTEATIPHFNKQLSQSLKEIFGKSGVDTEYFDEHVHIDKYHRNMVLNELILPSIKTYGNNIIPEIVKGFEEFKLLQSHADSDFMSQVKFDHEIKQKSDDINHFNQRFIKTNCLEFHEEKNTLSYSHIHDQDEIFEVKEGELEFFASLTPIKLKKGDSILIPKYRLHGTKVISEFCRYQTISI